jgi:agmatine deiminase
VTTPREQGFSMPPEWARHERCWMAWPSRPELWGERLAAAQEACAELARTILQFEPVTMIARPELAADASLKCGQGISVLPLEYDDGWTRDILPSFVCAADGRLAGIDWRLPGAGGAGEAGAPRAADAGLAAAICERLKIPSFAAPLALAGGAVQVDGEGTCLACAPALLEANPGRSQGELAALLADYLGVGIVIWLEGRLCDDPGGGLVDNVACFARPGVVAALSCRDEGDANHGPLQDNLARLRAAADAQGRTLEVIEIEQPAARWHPDGRRLCASYVNLCLANGALIVPMFDDAQDDVAFNALTAAFPGRQAIQLDAGDLIHGGGGIHRITLQQPAVAQAD